ITDSAKVVNVMQNFLPRKFCITLTTFAESVIPLHSISNDTMAGTGATGGTPRAGNPRPLVRLLYRSCASVTETSGTRRDATRSSRSISIESREVGITQKRPFAAIPGLYLFLRDVTRAW